MEGIAPAGRCCGCRRDAPLNNFVLMSFRGPVPGRGWGCNVCGLAMDGAIAVMCDECVERDAPPLDVCADWPNGPERTEAAPLRGRTWEHDWALHHQEDLLGSLLDGQGDRMRRAHAN